MHVQLLIATCNQGIQRMEGLLLPPMDDVSYLISHQYIHDDFKTIPPGLIRKDVTIKQQNHSGLSANRNNGLLHASGDVVMILDDDVSLKPEYISHVRDFFSSGEVDVACGMIHTKPGESEYKHYPSEQIRLSQVNQLKAVSSIELSIRLTSIKDRNIWFDERFGLGSSISSGEELIFLYECLKKGLNIRFFPEYTVEHPYQSSGKSQSPYSDERLFVAGAQAFAMYGYMGYARNLLSVFKRMEALKKENVSASHFLKVKQSGATHLRTLEKRQR